MRRSIFAFGCTLDTGETIDVHMDGITAIRVHPDKRVEITKPDGVVDKVDGEWVSYTARTL